MGDLTGTDIALELLISGFVIVGLGMMTIGAITPPNLLSADIKEIFRLQMSNSKVLLILGGVAVTGVGSIISHIW